MPLTFLPGSYTPSFPKTIEVDGITYRFRNLRARDIRPGDRVVFVDGTGPVGVPSQWGTVSVTDAWSRKSGRGRYSFIPEYQRRVIVLGNDWEGNLRTWIRDSRPWYCSHNEIIRAYRKVK